MFYLQLLNKIKSHKTISIYNYGKHYRSFTYIDDVISNLFKIINKFKKSNKKINDVFNIGNPTSINLKKFISGLENAIGKKVKKKYVNRQLGDLISTKSNVKREKKIFNHEIKVNLKTGLNKLVNWFNSYYK